MSEREPEDNIDDMGDDEQADDIALAEQNVYSPPANLDDEDEGSIGTYEYEREVTWQGNPGFPTESEPAEEAALHEEDEG
ncbi:hypothetical protein J4573_06375 [Actinomadura barringtoniae]|uniref:Uncharacterized protein n=1 Tax=Actinomadura barringtoniae TaxID=1427535 RepID=A0A939T2J4_9ACTN|nr:hypothetical protein [Actinomadura barringtoniae]MBO2446708.1 hypothetical protein [Actinomadura barringtoniae]